MRHCAPDILWIHRCQYDVAGEIGFVVTVIRSIVNVLMSGAPVVGVRVVMTVFVMFRPGLKQRDVVLRPVRRIV